MTRVLCFKSKVHVGQSRIFITNPNVGLMVEEGVIRVYEINPNGMCIENEIDPIDVSSNKYLAAFSATGYDIVKDIDVYRAMHDGRVPQSISEPLAWRLYDEALHWRKWRSDGSPLSWLDGKHSSSGINYR